MKLKLNFNKIMLIFVLIILCSLTINIDLVYGKVNSVYQTSGNVGSIDVDNAVADAPILTSIAHMIYALASFVEELVGVIVSIFTGHEMFPWADRIIFNTMPLLDINFLSPEPGSLFLDGLTGIPTDLGKIVRNLYYIIFVLSVTFFGVVVGLMALRLAISSIASEKAKYKQSIINWLLALILLFTTHYLMSFIFFVNEKMVEVASSIINLQDVKIDTDVSKMTAAEREKVAKVVLKKALEGWSTDIYYENSDSLIYYDPDYQYTPGLLIDYNEWMKEKKYEIEDFRIAREAFYKDYYENKKENETEREYAVRMWDMLGESWINEKLTWIYHPLETDHGFFGTGGYSKRQLLDKTMDIVLKGDETDGLCGYIYSASIYDTSTDDKYGIYQFDNALDHSNNPPKNGTTDSNLREKWLKYVLELYGDSLITADINVKGENDTFAIFIDAAYIMLLDQHYGLRDGKISSTDFINGMNVLVASKRSAYNISNVTHEEHFEHLWDHAQRKYNQNTAKTDKETFTGMADFFKKSVTLVRLYKDENGEDNISNFNAIPAILYAIFVIQSIMYFIAYLKRFFYIIILALFAPLVIVYDFLTKTAKG